MISVTSSTDFVREDGGLMEDEWFRLAIERGILDAKWPDGREQELFSIDPNCHMEHKDSWWEPMGVHRGGGDRGGGAVWYDLDRMERLAKWCPEVRLLQSSWFSAKMNLQTKVVGA